MPIRTVKLESLLAAASELLINQHQEHHVLQAIPT
jgi:hypothetical protein